MPMRIDRHDSSLGRWLLARWEPPHLSGIVEGIWYFEGSLVHLRERHFPTGRLDLIVHLGDVYAQVNGSRTDPFPRACVAGLLLGPDVIEAPPRPNAVLGVRLHPTGAAALLGAPIDELTAITVDLEDLAGSGARELVDVCTAARTPAATLRAAAGWIWRRTTAAERADPAVAWMTREIEARAGAVSIGALRDRTGWSHTRLTNVFREQVGVTPKVFARIFRFRRAMELVNERKGQLSRIAIDAGYYDHPHFNADFRELSGFSPSEYLASIRFPDSPSLAEQVG